MTTQKHIPAESDDFVGRARDVEELCQLLDATRLVTLCGPGGIGKTRLALRVAHSVPNEDVWFVELAEVLPGSDIAQIIRRVARTLGIAEEPGQDPADTLAGALRVRPGLLVVDTCEHLVEVCALLVRQLMADCPKLRVLATSREPLRIPGESVWRVPPLELPDEEGDPTSAEAVQLFAARAAAVRPGFAVTDENAHAVAEVCRMLDGVPLALELAAARVRVLSVEQLAARLVDRFSLLSTGDRTAPSRQRTLRAAIDWSHELLGEAEQILLRRLSVFSGWTIDPAEQVCADDLLPPGSVLDALTALVDKSLVVVDREIAGEVRFRLLDSIRQYGAERLMAAGENDLIRDRHRDWMLERAEVDDELAFGYRPGTWAQRVRMFFLYQVEHDNMRSALTWSLERGAFAEGLRMCLALRMHGIASGDFAEWTSWIERFLMRVQDAPPALAGAAYVSWAELALEQRDFALTKRCAVRGLELCRAGDETVMLSAGLVVLGQIALREGRLDEASEHVEESLATARAGGDRWNEGLALYAKASLLAARNRAREARDVCEQGISLMRAMDQQWGVSRGHIILGLFAQRRGDFAASRAHFSGALPALRSIGARPEMARSLGGIARAALAQHDLPAAREALTESLTLSRGMGLRLGVARGLESFAELHAAEGDHRRAVLLGGAAAALRETLGQPPATGARLETMLEPVRKHLGDSLVAQLWGEGRELSPDEAMLLAQRPAAKSLATSATVPSPRVPRHDSGGHKLPAQAVTPPSTLTTREREIAVLIARGLSNKAIAGELVISPATVARHVTNILTKLAFTSRAQIAAWAVDNGYT